MRLMVVGHPFLLAYNQKKYVAMKGLDPKFRVRLIVPSHGSDRFARTECQFHSSLDPEEVIPLPARMAGSHMTYLHNPLRIGAVLRDFQPEVIHIEEEPQALVTVETIALQRRFARPAAVTLFTWDNLLRRRRFPLGTLKERLRAYSLGRVASVICGNQRAAELLRAEGRYQGPVEVLPQYGLDVEEHQPGTEPGLRAKLGLSDGIVVGYIGRLVPEKGLRLVIDALRQLRSQPWKLLLVGAGPLEGEISKQWMAEFPGRIVLVPAVPYEHAAQYLRCMDIFVLASLSTPSWMEQFGLALAQAMLLGIPAVGSSSGAIPAVLGPGGLLFEEGQTESLKRCLESLLLSADRRREVGSLGREFALQNYTLRSVCTRYLAAFTQARSQAQKQPSPSPVGHSLSAQTAICESRHPQSVFPRDRCSEFAPVALFVYNRPGHTRKTVEALAKNEFAKNTDLFVFADGAKDEAAAAAVHDVRQLIARVEGFRSVTLIEREQNLGLNSSIIAGVTRLCEERGQAIVIEDDVVTAPDFLSFMNLSLNRYKQEPKVFSIGGFNIPNPAPPSYPYDVLFSYSFQPWGWATWKDRWEKADWVVSDFKEFMADRSRRKRFELAGNGHTLTLLRQMKGRADGFWDTVWAYNHAKYDAVQLLPVHSKTYNIGIGTGAHGWGLPFAQAALLAESSSGYCFPETVRMEAHFVATVRKLGHKSWYRRFGRRVFDALGVKGSVRP
jgi:glycosyltransferase involved in cell wall biosynthesis